LCKSRETRDPRAPFKKLYISAGFPAAWHRKSKTDGIMEVFWRGVWGETFFQKGPLQLTSSKAKWYELMRVFRSWRMLPASLRENLED